MDTAGKRLILNRKTFISFKMQFVYKENKRNIDEKRGESAEV